jgi:hypothetical protein
VQAQVNVPQPFGITAQHEGVEPPHSSIFKTEYGAQCPSDVLAASRLYVSWLKADRFFSLKAAATGCMAGSLASGLPFSQVGLLQAGVGQQFGAGAGQRHPAGLQDVAVVSDV